MLCKIEQKQRSRLRAWLAPVVVSVCVITVLSFAQAVSPILAVAIAATIITLGAIILRWF